MERDALGRPVHGGGAPSPIKAALVRAEQVAHMVKMKAASLSRRSLCELVVLALVIVGIVFGGRALNAHHAHHRQLTVNHLEDSLQAQRQRAERAEGALQSLQAAHLRAASAHTSEAGVLKQSLAKVTNAHATLQAQHEKTASELTKLRVRSAAAKQQRDAVQGRAVHASHEAERVRLEKTAQRTEEKLEEAAGAADQILAAVSKLGLSYTPMLNSLLHRPQPQPAEQQHSAWTMVEPLHVPSLG